MSGRSDANAPRYRDGLEAQADYRIKKGNKEARRRAEHLNAERREIAAAGATAFARCPIHGLHGERNECYVCGGGVELVAMVPVSVLIERDRYRAALNEIHMAAVQHQHDRISGIAATALNLYGEHLRDVIADLPPSGR